MEAQRHGAGRWRRPATVGEAGFSPLVAVGIGAFAILVALVMRWQLRGFVANDMRDFLVPWFHYLETNGLAGFGVEFSNYNFPYLFLVYLATKLPVSAITGIKLISVVFDLLVATYVGLIVRHVSGSALRGALAALVLLLLPTVVLNSAVWGQCDAVYSAVGLAALYAALRDRPALSWVLIGAALAVKLQAIFFLPLLALLWLRGRSRWWAPALAVPTWLVLTLPPVLFGRPLVDVLGVYAQQADSYLALTMGLPNAYAWLPAARFDNFVGPGQLLAVAALALVVLVGYVARRDDQLTLLLFAACAAAVAAYLLPQMHERYNYGFEVLALVLAAIRPRWTWLVAGSQAVALWGYSLYLFKEPPLMPWWAAAVVMLAVVVGVLLLWIRTASAPASGGPDTPALPRPRHAAPREASVAGGKDG